MSKLDDLIAELCPDGVEYKSLSDVCKISNGKDHKGLADGYIPAYGSGGVMRYVDTCIYDKQSVLIPRKGSLGNLFFVDTPFWTVDTIFYTKIKEKLIQPKFLYHYLATQHLEDLNSAGGVPSLTKAMLDKVVVSVPPLPVQQEIVRILDVFTALEAELEAELEARKKQYEYYRDNLLTFGNEVKWITLGESTEFIRNGYSYKADKDRSKTYKIARIETISNGKINMDKAGSVENIDDNYLLIDGDILFSHINSLPQLGNIAYYDENDGELYHGMNLLCFRCKQVTIIPRFLFYSLKTKLIRGYIIRHAKHACNQYSLSISDIKKWEIPVPPLADQERIVAILDRFDTFVNDITQGLPAEIAARRKQYEYYRDTLLTFKEMVS